MKLVNFFALEIEEDLSKLLPVENQSFPYRMIANPRRFEELLYSIYKLKIERNELKDYDDVSLMSGIAEQGRDVVLLRNGKSYGVIQCKKYEKNLSKAEFGREITKLVLYSLLDDRIIHDSNDFVYYIAVAKDFVADCRVLIDNFNDLILKEPDLDSWLSENLKMPTLQELKLKDYGKEARDILSKIKVKKIVPQDLDFELIEKPVLQPLFFAVRSVTDNSKVEKIEQLLTGDLSEPEVSKQLYNGSMSLISEKNTFEGIEDSHITRVETQQLINWVQGDAKKDQKGKIQNICLLAAPAGYGKTVILKDFYSACRLQNIPVLGLKADKLYSFTITELQKGIGLSVPVFDFVEKCKALYTLTVIVIDQIDALSQSMSSDRRFLDVFKGFINRFENDANIRIIISVRNQDLNYDPTLRLFRKNNTIHVSKLLAEQVFEQVEKVGITKNRLSSKLLELLRIPNNLNIFSHIASNKDSLKVTNLEELYTELWNQKVINLQTRTKTDKTKVREALYTIAEKMFVTQRITISILQLEDFSDEISYLESEQLIKTEEKQLQFFHQSFYDFVFAKQFVESEKDLITYIKEAEQSIHIRSAVKMIIAYLRDYDSSMYEKFIVQLISDDEIFFHIKHIVFLNLLNQSNPSQAEENLVQVSIEKSLNFYVLFLEHAEGIKWFEFALRHSLIELLPVVSSQIMVPKQNNDDENFDRVLKNLKVYFLQRFVISNETIAWDYFKQMEDVEAIQRILYFITDWSSDDTYLMLAKCPNFKNTDTFGYYHVLQNIIKYNEDFVIEVLKSDLKLHYKKGNKDRDYDEREVLKSLTKICPQKLLPTLYECMEKDLLLASNIKEGLIGDLAYSYTDLRDEDHYSGRDFLYQTLAYNLKAVAIEHFEIYQIFFNQHKSSRCYAIQRVLLFSIEGNEQQFANEIFELFQHFKSLNHLSFGNDLEFELRTAIEKCFNYLSKEQQTLILQTIKDYCDKTEVRFWTDNLGKKNLQSNWGLAKYFWLLRLPVSVIEADHDLKKSLLELQRRFPKAKDIRMKRNLLAGSVHSPIPVDAHQFMKKKHWLSSFRKYDCDRDRWGEDFLKGGITELSSAFGEVVKKDPSLEKLEIITAVINSNNIPITYAISGLYGWIQSNSNWDMILPTFTQILKNGKDYENTFTLNVAGNLGKLEKTTPEIISYLVQTSLTYKKDKVKGLKPGDKKTGINGLVTTAINTRYGAAANYLTTIGDSEFKDIIFKTIEEILKTGPAESRAAVYFHFYHLIRIDRDKAHKIFAETLNVESNPHVIASAIQSLQYFRSDGLKILDTPFRLLIESGLLGDEDSRFLFLVFYWSYLYDQDGAKELLETLLNAEKSVRPYVLSNIMKEYYTVEGTKNKNDLLLKFVIDKADEEVFDEISWNFHDAGHIALQDIYGFLKSYIQSKYFKLSDSFIEYLLTQCGKFPFLAVELFELAIVNNTLKLDERHNYQIDEKAMKFIVSAFEAINGIDKESKMHRRKLLSSFDKLITDLRFTRDQEKILNELI